MSYLVLARKYRPGTFDEVIGQSSVTTLLTGAINEGRIGRFEGLQVQAVRVEQRDYEANEFLRAVEAILRGVPVRQAVIYPEAPVSTR